MSLTTDEIEKAALSLPPEDRQRIVETLLDSLYDPEVEDAWDEEADRRYRAYLAGEMKSRPADQVIAEVRARLRR